MKKLMVRIKHRQYFTEKTIHEINNSPGWDYPMYDECGTVQEVERILNGGSYRIGIYTWHPSWVDVISQAPRNYNKDMEGNNFTKENV
jgi:hypothetical protein